MSIEYRMLIVFIIYVLGMWLIFDWIDKGNKRK